MCKINKKETLYYFFVALLAPFLISSIYLILEAEHQSLFSIMPAWSDEDFYYNQIKSMLEYGRPLGYYGYNGSHAPVGTFGAHGWFILLPYVAFCKIFGLHLNSIAIANHLMLAVAIFTYEMLFKPTKRRATLFATMICSPMLVFYVNSCMVEGENYFFAIMTAVLMCHIINNNGGKKAKIVLGILVGIAILSKVTWCVLLFPFVLVLLKDRGIKIIRKCLLAGAITVVGAVFAYCIYGIFTSPYFEGVYYLELYRIQIADNGLLAGGIYIAKHFLKNILSTFSIYDVKWVEISKNYVLTMGLFSFVYCVGERKKDRFSFIPSFVVGAYCCGILLLYGAKADAIRNIYPAVVFAITYILIMTNIKKLRCFGYVASAAFLIGTMIVQVNYGFAGRRWYAGEKDIEYAEIEEYMQNIKVNVFAETPWENTLVISLASYPDTIFELFVPAGVGLNYYASLPEDTTEIKAKYILLSNNNIHELEKVIEGGYVVVEQLNDSIILVRQ